VNAPLPTTDTQALIVESRRAATRRRRIFVSGATAGLIIAAGFSGLAYWQHLRVEEQRNAELLSQSRALAELANRNLQDGDHGTAILLALEGILKARSLHRPYAAEAEAALLSAWQRLLERTVVIDHIRSVNSIKFSRDSRRIVTASSDWTARVVDLETGDASAIVHDEAVFDASFSPDERFIITRSATAARIWDAQLAIAPIAVLRTDRNDMRSAAFSPDGQRVLTAGSSESPKIWDAKTGRMLIELKGPEKGDGARFSPDGQKIVTINQDNTARLWNAATGKSVTVLRGHLDYLREATFSPDGRRVITASSDGTARLWDAQTGKMLMVLSGHENTVYSAVFSPDGKSVLTGSADKTARIWNAATGTVSLVLKGHEGPVQFVSFFPNGNRVITVSFEDNDKAARIWDAQDGRLIEVLRGHIGNLTGISISSDGRHVATSSADETARIWRTESNTTLADFERRGIPKSVFL
jgi:WD40 repeat protein